MKKIIFRITPWILFAIAIVIFLFVTTFDLLPVEKKELSKINLPGKDYWIKIYYSSGNATVQNGIVVLKIEDGNGSFITKFDRYDSIVNYELAGDSLLTLVLSYTTASSKQDTFFVKIE